MPEPDSLTPGQWSPKDPGTDKVLTPPSGVVPFIGAGISTGAGAPSGAEIAAHLRTRYRPEVRDFDADDPRSVANNIISQGRATREEVQAYVGDLCDPAKWELQATPAVKAIACCPSGWVVTLSYDTSIELAAQHCGRRCRTFTWERLPPWEEAFSDRECLKVFHLHGRYDEPLGIVLDDEGYRRVEHDAVKAYLVLLLSAKAGCFLGTQLDESYIVQLLKALPTNQPKHVFFAPAHPHPAYAARSKVERPTAIVETFPVEDGGYSVVEQICRRYLVPSAEPVPPEPGFRFDAPTGLYVPQRLVAAPVAEEHSEIGLLWGLELGHFESITESELALRARTVVIGPPGSGKTELLRRAAEVIPPDERAVLVRLGSVGEPLGNPAAVLVEWARRAQDPDSGREVELEDLERRRFHFLLDGLDEVPSSRQTKLAQRITDIAEAVPQHRYTVTSRPVAATDAFVEPEWERLQLAATYAWRRAYLALAGVTEAELHEHVPALRDLEELLHLPFFFARLIEAYKAKQLPEHGDLLGVTQAFIDAALSHAELDPVREAVRPWLQDVAFVMQLSGRTELSREDLDEVPLPGELNLGPDEDVVDLLARRSLLEGSAEQVRFVHRLIGESLVAEKLLALGPAQPHLLDSVAPVSDLAVGLRSDWIVPVTLAAARDQAWRRAVGERDPLAAARTVPPSADVNERREAALTLWRSYVRSRVWMHSMRAPKLLQDSEALGRLLRRADLPDVVDELLGGTQSDSPQVRSNALEALADAGLVTELEPLIRAALAGDPNPVVRRGAASAAEQAGLSSAYALIRKLAFEATDGSEQQVMVSVVLRMAPPEDLVELVLSLDQEGLAGLHGVERVVAKRLGPRDGLRVMRARTKALELTSTSRRILKELLDELPNEAEAAEDVAYIATVFRDDDPSVRCVVQAHPVEALRGIIAAIDSGAARWPSALPFLSYVTVEQLEAAEFEDEELRHRLIDRKRLEDESTPPTPTPVGQTEDAETDERPPTLAELLADSTYESDDVLMANCVYFSSQVDGLDGRERRELARRVRAWWPEKGITESIHGNRVEWAAHACLTFGSQIKPKLTAEQWSEVARVTLPYDEKEEWLQQRYVRAGALFAARTWDERCAETWAKLAHAIPRKLPLAVVNAIAAQVRKGDSFLDSLAARLAAEGRTSALRKLSGVDEKFEETVGYYLARVGDFKQQRQRLNRLLAEFGGDSGIHSDDLGWMFGISDQRLLAQLFEALTASYVHRNPDRFNDSMAPIQEAIRRIDGPEALSSYDELLAADPQPFEGAQFLRYQRDTIADDMLRRIGDEQREALARDCGLPVPESPPPEQEVADGEPRGRTRYVVWDRP